MPTEPSLNIEDLRRVAEVVRARYTPKPVPPCPVCGGELSLASGGRGGLVYGCNAASIRDADHYHRSRFETHAGDDDVLSLLDRISSVEAERDEAKRVWAEFVNGNPSSPWAKLQVSEARVLSLEAEKGRLREALEPFAEHGDIYEPDQSDDQQDWPTFTVGDFRRASQALAEIEGKQG